jgi:hypothetical protein
MKDIYSSCQTIEDSQTQESYIFMLIASQVRNDAINKLKQTYPVRVIFKMSNNKKCQEKRYIFILPNN